MNWKKITPETEFDKDKHYLFCVREEYRLTPVEDYEVINKEGPVDHLTSVEIYVGKYNKYGDVWTLQELNLGCEYHSLKSLKENFSYYCEIICPEVYKDD